MGERAYIEVCNWDEVVQYILERDGACVYCGAEDGERRIVVPPVTLEIDHMIPRVRGGSDDIENLVAACQTCNRSKQDKTPLEWFCWIIDHAIHLTILHV